MGASDRLSINQGESPRERLGARATENRGSVAIGLCFRLTESPFSFGLTQRTTHPTMKGSRIPRSVERCT
jgi:hypothetical protein